jgi:hypothetical protein
MNLNLELKYKPIMPVKNFLLVFPIKLDIIRRGTGLSFRASLAGITTNT